jgi:hypothetical protein
MECRARGRQEMKVERTPRIYTGFIHEDNEKP